MSQHVSRPAIGQIVHFVMPKGDEREGEIRPAMIVRVLPGNALNLQVFLDGPNDRSSQLQMTEGWVGTVRRDCGRTPGTWYFVDLAPRQADRAQIAKAMLSILDERGVSIQNHIRSAIMNGTSIAALEQREGDILELLIARSSSYVGLREQLEALCN